MDSDNLHFVEPGKPRWRQSVKRDEVVGAIRQQLVGGEYGPGARLPTRTELINRFDVSAMTVQHALDRLKRDGFVVSRGRGGTFVSHYPPHLYHYGLVFSDGPVAGPDRQWPFMAALQNEAVQSDWSDRRTRIWVYRHLAGGSRSPDYNRLLADVRAQRLAGLIVADPWRARQWINDMSVPIVAFSAESVVGANDERAYAVDLDMDAFRERALDALPAGEIKRVGVLLGGGGEAAFREWQSAAARRGVELRPEWAHQIDLRANYWARHAALAMFRGDPADRPQALIIADDTLVEPAAAGLRDAAARVPEDVRIIAHANFPLAAPASIPATRLGFSPRESLRLAMQIINQLRRHQRMPLVTRMVPQFESELALSADEEITRLAV